MTVTLLLAVPATITEGGSATLSWTTTGASTVSISGVTGPTPVDGSTTVTPAATTTYTLTATGTGGTASSSVTVTVNPAAAETISVSRRDFRADKNEWRVEGASTLPGPGNTDRLRGSDHNLYADGNGDRWHGQQ